MEAFIRPESTSELDEITFQILSWEAFDETDDPDGEFPDTRYNIYAFGVNKESDSVCVRFEGYKPYFFALIPDKYQDTFDTFKRKEVEKYIRNKLFRNKEDLESVSVVTRKKYKGFTNEKEYKFLRFICKNLTTFNKIKWILNPKDTRKLPKISSLSPTEHLKFELYESKIKPYLRFTHKADIQMSGWVKVSKICTFPEMSRCQHSYKHKYNNGENINWNEVGNLKLGYWDIEACSS